MKLSESRHRFEELGAGLAAISVDSVEESASLAEEKDLTIPLLSDPNLTTISEYKVATQGEDIAVPATFVVTRDRKISWSHIGETMMDRPYVEVVLDQVARAEESLSLRGTR